MRPYPLAAALLEKHEGTILVVYDDATGKPIGPGSVVIGHPTLGTGFALDTAGITQDENDYLLDNRIVRCGNDLVSLFPNHATINEARWAALVDMRFNLGAEGFRGFTHLIDSVLHEDWEAAAENALASKWAEEVGQRAITDADILRTGEFPKEKST